MFRNLQTRNHHAGKSRWIISFDVRRCKTKNNYRNKYFLTSKSICVQIWKSRIFEFFDMWERYFSSNILWPLWRCDIYFQFFQACKRSIIMLVSPVRSLALTLDSVREKRIIGTNIFWTLKSICVQMWYITSFTFLTCGKRYF